MTFGGFINRLREKIEEGNNATIQDLVRILVEGPDHLFELFPLTDSLRYKHFGNFIRLCAIMNAKSGICDQDCFFCGQSTSCRTKDDIYPLLPVERILETAVRAKGCGATKFSIVGSGLAPSENEMDILIRSITAIHQNGISPCISFGMLQLGQLDRLRDAGLARFHHNIEASSNFYSKICTTRSWEDNANAVKAAKDIGLPVCCGGIFGMGEGTENRAEMILQSAQLGADSFPVNFLNPILGTPLADRPLLDPREALAIIAAIRIASPQAQIILCGGREVTLRSCQSLTFAAGASGLMIGDYLLTKGRPADEDLAMLEDLGLRPEPANSR